MGVHAWVGGCFAGCLETWMETGCCRRRPTKRRKMTVEKTAAKKVPGEKTLLCVSNAFRWYTIPTVVTCHVSVGRGLASIHKASDVVLLFSDTFFKGP